MSPSSLAEINLYLSYALLLFATNSSTGIDDSLAFTVLLRCQSGAATPD